MGGAGWGMARARRVRLFSPFSACAFGVWAGGLAPDCACTAGGPRGCKEEPLLERGRFQHKLARLPRAAEVTIPIVAVARTFPRGFMCMQSSTYGPQRLHHHHHLLLLSVYVILLLIRGAVNSWPNLPRSR